MSGEGIGETSRVGVRFSGFPAVEPLESADNGVMDASVIIPTYQRSEKLAACLRALSGQADVPNGFEVLVGFDGDDAEGVRSAEAAWSGDPRSLTLVPMPRCGLTRVRNRLLSEARGRVLISTNDDVIPSPGFVAAHVDAHGRAERAGRRVVVSGDSRWQVFDGDTAWDRMVRETPVIFFDGVMRVAGHAPEKDWGFRHAWGLNMSAGTGLVREVGGFTPFPAWYGYEDNELAFKLGQRFGPMPVIYAAAASLVHDHRVGAAEYVRREYALGFAALGFAQTSPECAAAMFGRVVSSEAEREYCREFVQRETPAAARAWGGMERLEHVTAASVDAGRLDAEYRAHLPLKRWAWRAGLLDAFEGRAMDSGGVLGRLGSPVR